MRKALFSVLTFALCAIPALANVEVDAIVVDQPTCAVKVQIGNTGSAVAGVDDVKLELKNANGWITVKHWDSAIKLQPGQKMDFEFTPEQGSLLEHALSQSYELQAWVSSHPLGPSSESANR